MGELHPGARADAGDRRRVGLREIDVGASIMQLVPEPAGYIESGRILFDGYDLLDLEPEDRCASSAATTSR